MLRLGHKVVQNLTSDRSTILWTVVNSFIDSIRSSADTGRRRGNNIFLEDPNPNPTISRTIRSIRSKVVFTSQIRHMTISLIQIISRVNLGSVAAVSVKRGGHLR